MPFRASVNVAGLRDPEHVAIFDNAGDPEAGGIEIRFEDVNQVDPAGRFRIRVVDDSFFLEQSTEPDWAAFQSFLSITGDSVALTLPDDEVSEALVLLLKEVRELREYLSLVTA